MNEFEWQLLEDKATLDRLTIEGTEVKVGDRVRLRPRQGGDVLDIALAGQTAIIESLEQDYDGKNHVCVVLENDPGRDLGMLRQPGHRFFFDANEVEPLPAEEAHAAPAPAQARILVAGIGNIFMGDDGFGVEVVRRLAAAEIPAGVRVTDFGIRGLDLAYALQDGYETTILVDAYPHGQPPGAVSLVEPDLSTLNHSQEAVIEAHGMDPMKVLRMAAGMNAPLKKILLVGCEPATFGGEEGAMGLSSEVEAGVDGAVKLILSVVQKVLQEPESRSLE
ncbi:MAG TPA: hydrogenase maturation protease [Candidatus Sulfotelmatobacter sp.]|nr:hydrogenase maturation protease [Candidatus Sulfotelmatobacter sp.]